MNKRLRKTMKKWMAGILGLLLVVTSNVIPAKAAISGMFAYEVISGQAHITDCDITITGDLEIPETIDGYQVVGIGAYAFGGCSELTSITIPEGVTNIASYAFGECSGVKSISIPSSVTSIDTYAFLNCESLTSIEIPASVTSIGKGMFKGCSSLTEVTIPTGVTSIGASAFEGCSSLTSIEIPAGVTSIGDKAFYNCSSLTSVTIPAGVTSIGASTFYGCSSLISVGIPTSVTSIGANAFYNCSSLSNASIPTGVTSIGNAAFNGCSSLKEVTIPAGVTSIGTSIFNGCSSLTSLTISEGVTSIGNYAFYGCSSLTRVNIPKGVTSVGNNAFAYCENLTDVSLPSTVTSIGNYAFSNCGGLENINIPEGVTKIGNYAFYECSSLTNVVLPESVTSLGKGAFQGCSNLTNINIPTGVTSIGDKTFYNCSSLKSIEIPSGVTSIGASSFAKCSSLEALDIPEGVTSIGDGAFQVCNNLSDVTIPQSVTSIGENAFAESNQVVIYTTSEYVKNYADDYRVDCIWLTDKIEVKQLPDKIDYFLNDEFSSEGLILLAYHGDVKEEVTSGYEVSGFDSSETGTCTITVTYNGQTTTFDVVIHEVPSLRVSSAALQLENDITVVFRTKSEIIDGVYTDVYAIITQELENGKIKSETIEGVKSADDTCYEFKYTGLAAKEVGDLMDITIYGYRDGVLVTGETTEDYGIMSYCMNQLGKNASDIGLTETKMAAFKTLLVDIINYASEAQVYFGYKTDALVSDQLTDEQKALASDDSVLEGLEKITDATYDTVENPSVTWKAVTLQLLSRATIRVKVYYEGNIEDIKLYAEVAGETFEVTDYELADTNAYYFYFDEITAFQFGESVDFYFMEGDTVTSNTLRYSVESYATNKLEDATVGDVVSALMKYGKAAITYNEAE